MDQYRNIDQANSDKNYCLTMRVCFLDIYNPNTCSRMSKIIIVNIFQFCCHILSFLSLLLEN